MKPRQRHPVLQPVFCNQSASKFGFGSGGAFAILDGKSIFTDLTLADEQRPWKKHPF